MLSTDGGEEDTEGRNGSEGRLEGRKEGRKDGRPPLLVPKNLSSRLPFLPFLAMWFPSGFAVQFDDLAVGCRTVALVQISPSHDGAESVVS
jgi:hypothetical protein